ncbi:hypothetical protein B7463_g9431, partial [Scytalidium lignicola]
MANTASSKAGKPFDVAVLGGGIGGLCLAIGLLKKGVPVTIYEAAPAFSEIGAGVAFGSNSTKAMGLISEEIKEGHERCATRNWSEDKLQTWFDYQLGQDARGHPAGTHIYESKSPRGQSSVHRAHFLDELVKLIPTEIANFGKRLVNYEEDTEGVTLKFEDGTTAKHTCLIGCDGIKSITRQILLGEDNPVSFPHFTGKYAYRGLIPMDKAAVVIGDRAARNSQMYLGHGGHVLTFPVTHGSILNVVAFQSLDKWEDERWVKPVEKQKMMDEFSTWSETVKSVLNLIEKPENWALFNHDPAETYTKGRVCLLGDAAHATTPHQGSGAGMAIEDALILIYDQLRRPRSQKLVATSIECGHLYELELPGYEDDIEKVKENLAYRMKWIWEHDLEADVETAKENFKKQTQ